MRIVIDMQGAQSESRSRGIGRYSLALALAIARNAQQHEVWLVLNGALGAAIEDIREAFAGLVPRERIRVFDIVSPCAEIDPRNSPRARANELLREYFIAQIAPDAVLVTSLFEGYIDDAVVSVGRFLPGVTTAVILYDLIPLLNPATYLANETQRHYYDGKLASLRQAGLLLAISDYSREEALDALDLAPGQVVSISTAADACFTPAPADEAELAALRTRFGLRPDFLMYAPGGFDSRKNIDGLITAFSTLPADLRARYQLLIASKVSDGQRLEMERHAQRCGLASGQVILTGYVDDATLTALYRTCALFVFPSKHEGFGLPALEAMACGAAVIGANTTSVPEVVGCEEALFDPHDPAAIASRITQVLRDPAMLARLRTHGRTQAALFSWDASARRALRAIEQHHDALAAVPAARAADKPRIAFVSPLPPARTGVADYAIRVLPTLLPYFDVDLIVEQESVSLPPALTALPCHDAHWLRRHADDFDHIIYQLGNSPFHGHMLALLAQHPGVVVLHDFYLSSALAYAQMTGALPGAWTRALFASHGYRALKMNPTEEGWEQAKNLYPSNLEILQDASHVIVHSQYTRQLARDWYGHDADTDWTVVPQPRAGLAGHDRATARAKLGIAPNAFVVCNFGFVAPTKHCHELVQAWLAAGLAQDATCELIFVGANDGLDYGVQLSAMIRAAGAQHRIRITDWISEDDYGHYLQAADVGVQLRTGSRGETSSTALDCLVHGLPTIMNANGSMAEFPDDAVCMLPDRFSVDQLARVLAQLRTDEGERRRLGRAAIAFIETRHSPERCGMLYREALTKASARRHTGRAALYQRLLDTEGIDFDDALLHQCARSMARARDPLAPRQLLVDVTAIARHDLKTGIERVVRTQLHELLQLADSGLRVEPVYFQHEDGALRCRYARRYAASLLGIDAALPVGDELVDVQAGDIYYSGDHSPHIAIAAAREGLFAHWRMRGVEINVVLYDLLPVLRPDFFPPGADLIHGAWLSCIPTQAHRVIGISDAVAQELRGWLAANAPGQRQPAITSLHLGADIAGPAPAGAPQAEHTRRIAERPSFLMVGTIEPRKGHLQTLDAFDLLWQSGVDINLVVVGNEGWKALPDSDRRTIPRIVERLRNHPESGRRLFWLTGTGDDELRQLYSAASCLLAPSEGEGFGLPLIEGARHGLPVLARDLPVFREVGGEGADYFNGLDGASLADALRDWLARSKEGRLAPVDKLRWMTWQDNVGLLLDILNSPSQKADR